MCRGKRGDVSREAEVKVKRRLEKVGKIRIESEGKRRKEKDARRLGEGRRNRDLLGTGREGQRG